jgi:hypothetical protein
VLRRALARQGRDPVGSPAGEVFGPDSYGHTGFSGTSTGDGIVALRRAFHDAVARTPPVAAEAPHGVE